MTIPIPGHRKIIHIDMDAFYASVEQRDDPALRGRPVAVGGSRERGVVAAASYEARRFGVHSAMPSITARRKCPELVFVKPRFEIYKVVSEEIHAIFAEFTTLIEPLSLDEAYLDVTENHVGLELATDIARAIRKRIRDATGLTASAGVSYNKFLAKMASSQRKPDGQFVIPPGRGEAFVETLPIHKFHGVGPATAQKMQALGIDNGAALKRQTLEFLQQHFGKAGPYFFHVARGIDTRAVRPDRVRKSIGAERTFSADIFTIAEAREQMGPIIEKVMRACHAKNLGARTVTLKVKFADFEQITRRVTVADATNEEAHVVAQVDDLLAGIFPVAKGVRLLGVSLSSLDAPSVVAPGQMRLAL